MNDFMFLKENKRSQNLNCDSLIELLWAGLQIINLHVSVQIWIKQFEDQMNILSVFETSFQTNYVPFVFWIIFVQIIQNSNLSLRLMIDLLTVLNDFDGYFFLLLMVKSLKNLPKRSVSQQGGHLIPVSYLVSRHNIGKSFSVLWKIQLSWMSRLVLSINWVRIWGVFNDAKVVYSGEFLDLISLLDCEKSIVSSDYFIWRHGKSWVWVHRNSIFIWFIICFWNCRWLVLSCVIISLFTPISF